MASDYYASEFELADKAMEARDYLLAQSAYESLLATPSRIRALCGLGSAKLEAGDYAGATSAADKAIKLDPGCGSAYLVRAKSMVATGDDLAALPAFLAAADVRSCQTPRPPEHFKIPAHFALHNAEQLEYLCRVRDPVADELPDGTFTELNVLITQLREIISNSEEEVPWISISGSDGSLLANLPNVRYQSNQRPKNILNPTIDFKSIDTLFNASTPSVQVIDDFLSPDALNELRAFAMRSTVWKRPYKFGYVGAFAEDGFVDETLLRLSRESQKLLPKTLAALRLTQWWCFAYDSQLPGTSVHGDDADITINLWITPDEANEDAESGGLIIWDQMTPASWTFDEMNSGGSRIQDYLAESGANSQLIPYRENRAVLFNGRLFHQTDSSRFSRGYENRRRNLTFLFRT